MDGNAQHSRAFEPLVSASNELAFQLLSELARKDRTSNILISPLSVSFALCLLYNGAGGATRQALQSVLAMSGFTVAETNQACLELSTLLVSGNSENLVRFANALWAHSSSHFYEDFTRTVRHFYAAEVSSLDFLDPASLAGINEWAKKQTDGKIFPLLNSDDISAETECVMCAACYVKGAWAVPFPPEATHEGPFHLGEGRTREVLLMRQTGRYQFHQTPHFQAIGLPYCGERLSMYVLLPSENSSLAELVQRLDAGTLEECLAKMKQQQIILLLPRFKMTYEVELKGPLSALGLGEMFVAGADFSPMGLSSQGVEKFKHKTFVEVNEEGTEAAAVSTVILGRSLPRTLLVNRPFFWTIRDNLSGALIFTSLVWEPR